MGKVMAISFGGGMARARTLLVGSGHEVSELEVDSAAAAMGPIGDQRPDLVLLSAQGGQRSEMKAIIEGLKARGLRDEVKVLLLGEDVEYSDQIGADAALGLDEVVRVVQDFL